VNEQRSADRLADEPPPSSSIRPQAVVLLILVAALGRLVWVLFSYYLELGARRHHLESAWILFSGVALLEVIIRARSDAITRRGNASALSSTSWLVAALAASIILYWPSLSIGLLSDDFVLLHRGPFIDGWGFFRPLPLAIWQLVFPVAGATGLHLLNVVLHGVNTWLLYLLLIGVGVRAPARGIAAALFLTFPASVEAVAWSSGVFDVALVCFGLIYLIAATRRSKSSRAAGAIALVSALLTKETAVALPIMALFLGLRLRIDRGLVVGSIAVVAAYALVRLVVGIEVPGPEGPWSYVLKELVARPFAALAVPWTVREVRAAPFLLAVGPQLAIAGLAAGYAGSRHVTRSAIVPLLWIVAAVAPLYGLFVIGDELSGSRYLYLPLLGWCLLLADLIQGQFGTWGRRVGTALVIVAVTMGAPGVRTHLRPWIAAAELRDSVLHEAGAAVRRSGCAEPEFLRLPDTVDGAFVFRNGFPEALASQVGLSPSPSASPECTFVWSGTTFSGR